MKEKKGLPIYEPPRARDLSMMMAEGGDEGVTGECISGEQPYEECIAGPSPGGVNPDCYPFGMYVYGPQCKTGSTAAVVCYSGGDA